MEEILRIESLTVAYRERAQVARACDRVTLSLGRGETLALVGESGSGKTTAALAVLDLVPSPGVIEHGRVLFEGIDLLAADESWRRSVRGRRISMIFQDAVSGLNPVLNIGKQVEEIVRTHMSVTKTESRRMAAEALRRQGLWDADRIMAAYPHQLSGGMCQRVMIAIATVLRPDIIIADEPTSSLDVTVQAEILHELNELRRNLGISILLIAHDLGVVARMADRVAVMYAGRIIETGATTDIFSAPAHPYTAALMAARPPAIGERRTLQVIRGTPPDLASLTGECAFLPRCPKAVSACRTEPWPTLTATSAGGTVACFNPMYSGA